MVAGVAASYAVVHNIVGTGFGELEQASVMLLVQLVAQYVSI